MESLNGITPQIGDRIGFLLDVGGGNGLQGEGFVVLVEPRGGGVPWMHIAMLGAPNLLVLPAPACRVLERGALIRRVVVGGAAPVPPQ